MGEPHSRRQETWQRRRVSRLPRGDIALLKGSGVTQHYWIKLAWLKPQEIGPSSHQATGNLELHRSLIAS